MPLMKQAETEWKSKGGDVTVEFVDDHGLIAVQGPEAVKIVQSLITDQVNIHGIFGYISRWGRRMQNH
jgi:glycine cleavage system aminomethyltransferase T